MDIENGKVDIQDKKVDIESVLSEKGSNFSVKTTVHIHRLFEKFGFDEVFGKKCGYGTSCYLGFIGDMPFTFMLMFVFFSFGIFAGLEPISNH